MSKVHIFSFGLLIVLGVCMFVYGEMDDSPGGQLLGLIAVVIGTVGTVKSWKKPSF
jgi:hypothetical protein